MESNRTIRVAVVGSGTMGQVYASCLKKIANADFAGFHSRPTEAANAAAERFGTRLYGSYEELLANPDIDAVCITLPTYLHREYAIQALENGKHVICEKPIALNVPDAEAMISASERYGRKLLVGHILRFMPEYRNVYNHVRKGSIGNVGVGHAKRASLHPPAGSWFHDGTLSGGVLFDLMIHDIDFMLWTVGSVRSVYAKVHKAPGIEYANATLRFDNGAIANLEAHWGYPGPFRAEVELAGSAGILRSSNSKANPMTRLDSAQKQGAGEGVYIPQSMLRKDPYLSELEHFISCIRTGAEPIVTASDATDAVRIALAAGESARTGLPQRL
jgi:UDP-N-acetylglucosamine 3-dehydrogenase